VRRLGFTHGPNLGQPLTDVSPTVCYNSHAMALTVEEVRHIAKLARLDLTREEEERYREQLSAILEYAARLAQVDTSAIPPTATVLPMDAPLREDAPRVSASHESILLNAPSSQEGMFRIPPVLDTGP